jgi:tol-pal system protein YbgF
MTTTKREFSDQTDALKSRVDALDEKLKSLDSQTAILEKKSKSLADEAVSIRQSQADRGADITDIRNTLAALSGRVDLLQKDTTEIKNGLDKLNARMDVVEKYLDLGGRKVAGAVPESSDETATEVKGKNDSTTAYDLAFNSFKEEKYAKSRSGFEAFLARYPEDQKAADAHYWIGESYYFEGIFDQAIFNYDKVVKKYPTSDKVPRALFKEGLSFYKLSDATTAKLLFEQVVQSYPDSLEAKMARKKLQEMK